MFSSGFREPIADRPNVCPRQGTAARKAPRPRNPQTYGGATSNAAVNPDISLTGDFTGIRAAAATLPSPSPSLQLHETEVGMQAIIDPYASAPTPSSLSAKRASPWRKPIFTFTSISFRPAYRFGLAGKMRADFGKVKGNHPATMRSLASIARLATNNLLWHK